VPGGPLCVLAKCTVGRDHVVHICRVIEGGVPSLVVRKGLQSAAFAGCALSALVLALDGRPSVNLAITCITTNHAFYALSFGGAWCSRSAAFMLSVIILHGCWQSVCPVGTPRWSLCSGAGP